MALRRILASTVAAGTLAVGGVAFGSFSTVDLLGAQETSDEAPAEAPESRRHRAGGALGAVLDELVEEGVLSADQAQTIRDRVAEKVTERRGDRPGPRHRKAGAALGTAAEAIGIDADALAEALRGGQTIAEVAEANGIDPATVIDALVAAGEERIAAALDAGRIDEDEAADARERLAEKMTTLVNEGRPGHGPGSQPGDAEGSSFTA